MARLLVRDLDKKIVDRLKERAKLHGISTEEEHRRILNEALLNGQNRQLTLMEFLLSEETVVDSPDELNLDRSKDIDQRDIQ